MLLLLSIILTVTVITITVLLLVVVFSVSFVPRFIAVSFRTPAVKFSLIVEISVIDLGYEFDYNLQHLRFVEFINLINNVLLKAIIKEYN